MITDIRVADSVTHEDRTSNRSRMNLANGHPHPHLPTSRFASYLSPVQWLSSHPVRRIMSASLRPSRWPVLPLVSWAYHETCQPLCASRIPISPFDDWSDGRLMTSSGTPGQNSILIENPPLSIRFGRYSFLSSGAMKSSPNLLA